MMALLILLPVICGAQLRERPGAAQLAELSSALQRLPQPEQRRLLKLQRGSAFAASSGGLLKTAPRASLAEGEPENATHGNPSLYSTLMYSVVRISTVDKELDIMKPWEASKVSESVGSGFMVDFPVANDGEDDFTIITNAHVVKGSSIVRVQLPALGRKLYDATVPLICVQFDLAIVKLSNHSELKDSLREAKAEVQTLKLQNSFVQMGMKVAALGFPLGSQGLKLSEGVVAGAESVNDNMVYQSTAPISPGNSGGPLLVFREEAGEQLLDTIVGVNFATASSDKAQNLNYAVPAFRILQLLEQYGKQLQSKEALDEIGTGNPYHMSMRIAPVGILYTQSTPAQIQSSGCKTGIQIDKISRYSLFRWAEPPVPELSFLTKIEDTELDIFGMGKRGKYMQQYVSFKDLLTFRETISGTVEVTTCKDGKESTHSVSLSWNSTRFEPGVRYVEEPLYDSSCSDYELFAGVTMMQMTLNHVDKWFAGTGGETQGRFYLEENQVNPRVVIADCSAGSTCEHILGGGMTVASINGCNVTTLADVRACFVPEDWDTWELVTERGIIFVADFKEELVLVRKLSKRQPQLLTKAVKAALNYKSTTRVTENWKAQKKRSWPQRHVMRRAEIRADGSQGTELFAAPRF